LPSNHFETSFTQEEQRQAAPDPRLGLVECCCGFRAEPHDVGKKFARSSLGQEPLLDLRGTGRHQDDFDPRIFFLEGMPFGITEKILCK